MDGRDHVHHLAGRFPPPRHTCAGWADAGLTYVLDALPPVAAALITDDLSTVIAQNPSDVVLLGPLAAEPGRRRTFVWRWSTDPHLRAR